MMFTIESSSGAGPDTERREVLAQSVRPGNAGSNTAIDHVEALATAIDALPQAERAGHRWDDHADPVGCELVIRPDTAGASPWLAEEYLDRNCRFSPGYAIDDRGRLIVRRERADPEAQLSSFDDIERRSHTALITKQPGAREVLELTHRQRGAAEDVIRDLKACGYANWPCDDIVTNQGLSPVLGYGVRFGDAGVTLRGHAAGTKNRD